MRLFSIISILLLAAGCLWANAILSYNGDYSRNYLHCESAIWEVSIRGHLMEVTITQHF